MTAAEGPNMTARRAALASAPCPCRSGRLTRDCHDTLLRPPTPEDFFTTIERGLKSAPRLQSLVPTGYPRSGRAKLDYAQAMAFEERRTTRHQHNFNLPLVLSLAGNADGVPGARSLAGSLLGVVERFASQFSGAPGAKAVLTPLWRQAWDVDDPCFWSVIANCHLAVRHRDSVIGFERPTGHGAKTTDLLLATKEGTILLEVEMWHDPRVDSADAFAAEFRRRVEAKASAKFPEFRPNAMGVVVELAFVNEAQLEMLRRNAALLEPVDVSVQSRWVGQLMIAVQTTNALGVITGYEFIDYTAPLRPPPPIA